MPLYLGLMSGTSMDGIDAALVELPENDLKDGITKKYSDTTKQALEELLLGQNLSLASICQLNTLIGREFAQAALELLQKTKTSAKNVVAIGSHGQTVCHDTSVSLPYTLQLGCGHTIASLTGITVVADFRTRDLINGGQGAPFAPIYHQVLLAQTQKHLALVNLGGIANITFLAPGKKTQGWDIGPANCLMDAWIKEHLDKPYDQAGAWAQQGQVILPLLDLLLSDSILTLAPPKSMGKEYFSLTWLKNYLKPEYPAVDVQATLLAFTAHSIKQAIVSRKNIGSLYLCGGGTHNQVLHQTIASLLPQISVNSISDLGWDADYLEAMMFAWFASQAMNQIPIDLSHITGSKSADLLGVIYPALKLD